MNQLPPETSRQVAIIGAGPAGLTAGIQLLRQTTLHPVVLEAQTEVGGLAKTVDFAGNRMDIGGHRFYTKSQRVLDWWGEFLAFPNCENLPPGHEHQRFLLKQRRSRIYYHQHFFEYPLTVERKWLSALGWGRCGRILFSYLRAQASQGQAAANLEEFFVQRFGQELYETFFRSYTEKVWGVSCRELSADWGHQRVRGLTLKKVLMRPWQSLNANLDSLLEKGVETSLIDRFLYPVFGPGQFWNEVARQFLLNGGDLRMPAMVQKLTHNSKTIQSIHYRNALAETRHLAVHSVISSMPLNKLIQALEPDPDRPIRKVSDHLPYRAMIIVGLLLQPKASFFQKYKRVEDFLPDNWLYIQQEGFHVGRIQVFNNWSEALVKDPNTLWLGMEYFVEEGEKFWCLDDSTMAEFALKELDQLELVKDFDLLNNHVLRVPKAYPAYHKSYQQIHQIRDYLDGFENLYVVGRNGMHRYNNQDHSMLTAMAAVELIRDQSKDRSMLWKVNSEPEYLEEWMDSLADVAD